MLQSYKSVLGTFTMMKFLLLSLLLLNSLNATDIETLISQIKVAKPEQKRVLINRLKSKLKHTHNSKRLSVIKRLRLHRKLNRGNNAQHSQTSQQKKQYNHR